MKYTIILFFLTCQFLASSQNQTFVEEATKDTITISQELRTRLDTVFVLTRKKYSPTPVVVTTPVVSPVAGYTIVYSCGYNSISDLTRDNGQYGNGTISTSIKTEGAGSFLSIPAGNTSNGFRSEDQFTNGSKAINVSEGSVEYNVRYEYLIANNAHSVQWHPSDSRASAALALWHKNGLLVLGRDINASANGFKPSLNKWYRFRIEFNFANSGGYARWYINDGSGFKLQAEIKGLPVSSGGGQYFKLGVNAFNNSNDAKSRVYYDDLKIYTKDNSTSSMIIGYSDNLAQAAFLPLGQQTRTACAVYHMDGPCPGYPNPSPSPDTANPKLPPQPTLTDSTLFLSKLDMEHLFKLLGEKIQLPDGSFFMITGNERDNIAYIFEQAILIPAAKRWMSEQKQKK